MSRRKDPPLWSGAAVTPGRRRDARGREPQPGQLPRSRGEGARLGRGPWWGPHRVHSRCHPRQPGPAAPAMAEGRNAYVSEKKQPVSAGGITPGGSWGSVRAQRRKTRLPWSGRRGGAGAGEAKGLVVGGNSGDLSWQCAQSAPRGQDLVGGQGSPMQDRLPSGDRARQRAWGLASAQPGPPHRRGGRGGPHVGGHACRWASLRGGRGAPRAVPGTPAGRGGREAEGDGALEPAVRGSQCCRLWGIRDLAREDAWASAQADTQ